METISGILGLVFALGIFVPLVLGLVVCVIGLLVLPFVLIARR